MQRLWLCHHDQLRRGTGGNTKFKRIHTWKSCPASIIQDQQVQNLVEYSQHTDTHTHNGAIDRIPNDVNATKN